MKLRDYDWNKDFDEIKTWGTDHRLQRMWSGSYFEFPLNKENFENVLKDSVGQLGEHHYVAMTDEGEPMGFFGYHVNPETNIGKYRFVVVSPKYRGQGFGKQMMKLAVRMAFETSSADQVMLTVFTHNVSAKCCYERAGFVGYETKHNYLTFEDENWDLLFMKIDRPSKLN